MPVINYCYRIAEDLKNLDKYGVKTDTKIFLVSSLYAAFYELMIELLFDIALKIAKRSPDDKTSMSLRRAQDRKPYRRNALFEFLKKKGYSKDVEGEFLLQLKYFRDKISHLLFYYDTDREKLFCDGKYIDPSAIREIYEKLVSLFSYMLVALLRESRSLDGLRNIPPMLQNFNPKPPLTN